MQPPISSIPTQFLTIIALVITALPAPQARAQDDTINRPSFAGRVVRAFGFEERDTNPLPVPKGWIRAQHDPSVPRDRPGFPLWNRAVLDYTTPPYHGIGSVKLPTNGGSTSLILRYGELSVFPAADYIISARVRTENLLHSRARMVAVMIDQHGNELEVTRATSDLVNTQGEWALISVFLEGTEPDAAFIRVELQILQPKQQPRRHAPAPFTVWEQDYDGAAWFDNVVIAQMPMIGLTTTAQGNIVRSESPPPLSIDVRDLTGEDLRTNITVTDPDGLVVDSRSFTHGTNRLRADWTPDLPKFGWYRAHAQVTSGNHAVGERTLDFIWSPKTTRTLRSPFRLGATSAEPKLMRAIPELAQGAGVWGIDLPIWSGSNPETNPSDETALVNAIDELIDSSHDVRLDLTRVPEDLVNRTAVDPHAILSLVTNHRNIAMSALGPIMDRYGQVIDHWSIGIGASEDSAQELIPQLARADEVFDPYIPGAIIGLGWPIDRAPEPGLGDRRSVLHIADHPSFPDDAYADLFASINQEDPPPRVAVTLRADDTGAPGATAARLARRAISAWAFMDTWDPETPGATVTLLDPWTVEPGKRGRVMPTPGLMVWRTLTTELGQRRPISEPRLIEGVRMILCSPPVGSGDPTDGALIVWTDSPNPQRRELGLPLSLAPVRVVDLFANESTVAPTTTSELGLPVHDIPITRAPIIITGVTTALVELLDSMRLTPDTLDATSGVHQHTFTITNPFPHPVRGKVYIVEPGGYSNPGADIDRTWDIDERVINFNLDANETLEQPTDIVYSQGQLSGPKPLVFDIELSADETYPLIRVPKTITLDTQLLDLDLALTRSTGTTAATLEVRVTGRSDDPLLLDLTVIAPNTPRQQGTINGLSRLSTSTREFGFKHLEPGDKVFVSVSSSDLGLRLSKEITAP